MTGGQSGVRKRESNKIVKKVWIKASPKVIFSALTEPKELVHWFCDRATCDLREGGELAAHWREAGQKGRARITRIADGSHLELLWIDDGRGIQENSAHQTRYEIHTMAGMTELVMTDIDEPVPDEQAFAALDQGWNSVLMDLKEYCERRERSAKIRPRSKSGARSAAE